MTCNEQGEVEGESCAHTGLACLYSGGSFSMKERMMSVSLFVAVLLATSAQAQVMQLGRVPMRGSVRPTGGLLGDLFGGHSSSCDSGCADGPACGVPEISCGAPEVTMEPVCGCPEPACGAEPTCGAAPSCGMAGGLLGALCRGGGGGCATCPEPACGATGLGYAGGFGSCGSCDTCGVGGYIGRNLHQVNPCACGGSLIADMARGFLGMVDRAVGSVVGGIFGGLQAVSCHASGTFATLQCAAAAGCDACDGASCDDCCAPSCGAPSCDAPACSSCGVPEAALSYPVTTAPTSEGVYLPEVTPLPASPQTATESVLPSAPVEAYDSGSMDSYPAESIPTPVESSPIETIPMEQPPATNPFLEDPAPMSQLRSTSPVSRGGFRFFRPNTAATQPQRNNQFGRTQFVQRAQITRRTNEMAQQQAAQLQLLQRQAAQLRAAQRQLAERSQLARPTQNGPVGTAVRQASATLPVPQRFKAPMTTRPATFRR